MRWKNISIKKETVTLEYEEKNSLGTMDTLSMVCKDEPAPEFTASIQAFDGLLIQLCEFPKDDKKSVTVTAVHFSYHGDNSRLGIVVSGFKKLKNYSGAVTFNTPCMLEPEDKPNSKKDIPESMGELLDALKKQAAKFLKGYRQQIKAEI